MAGPNEPKAGRFLFLERVEPPETMEISGPNEPEPEPPEADCMAGRRWRLTVAEAGTIEPAATCGRLFLLAAGLQRLRLEPPEAGSRLR